MILSELMGGREEEEDLILIGGNVSKKTELKHEQIVSKNYYTGRGEVFWMNATDYRFPLHVKLSQTRNLCEVYISTTHDNPNSDNCEKTERCNDFMIHYPNNEANKGKIEKVYFTVKPYISFTCKISAKFYGSAALIVHEDDTDEIPYQLDEFGHRVYQINYREHLDFSKRYDTNIDVVKAQLFGGDQKVSIISNGDGPRKPNRRRMSNKSVRNAEKDVYDRA
jgi:hypothetical protein